MHYSRLLKRSLVVIVIMLDLSAESRYPEQMTSDRFLDTSVTFCSHQLTLMFFSVSSVIEINAPSSHHTDVGRWSHSPALDGL